MVADTSIEVRVGGRGTVVGEVATPDAQVTALCDLCGKSADCVASMHSGYACAACLRHRLEAMSVARWRLSENTTLPWGKLTS